MFSTKKKSDIFVCLVFAENAACMHYFLIHPLSLNMFLEANITLSSVHQQCDGVRIAHQTNFSFLSVIEFITSPSHQNLYETEICQKMDRHQKRHLFGEES